jgi:hypothetical protein
MIKLHYNQSPRPSRKMNRQVSQVFARLNVIELFAAVCTRISTVLLLLNRNCDTFMKEIPPGKQSQNEEWATGLFRFVYVQKQTSQVPMGEPKAGALLIKFLCLNN